MNRRVYLSPPDVGTRERELLLAAFDSGWIAPVGPDLDAFEAELAVATGRRYAVALSSGTAALHLALVVLGVGRGDEVVVPTLTFAATPNAVSYVGATPVFVDVDARDWTLDVDLLSDELERRARYGIPQPAAIVPVDLYGQCADYGRLVPLAGRYGVPIVADAAEALGAAREGYPAGSYGWIAALSFNGNKVITTSGGGALVTDDVEVADRVRMLATQAREPVLHYEHREVGFNYRLSNILGALGRAQLEDLEVKVSRRRKVNARYREALAELPGVAFMEAAPGSEPSWWLTCLTVDPVRSGTSRDAIIDALARDDIEARPVWKPMHLQPVFADHPRVGGDVAERLFDDGICLPSGSSLSAVDQERVIDRVLEVVDAPT